MRNIRELRLVTLALAMGVVGGAILVVSWAMFAPGKELLVPYAALMLVATALTRAEKIASFAARFSVLLSAFMFSTLVLYVAVALRSGGPDIALMGHAWRLALLLAIGAAVSLPLARLSEAPAEVTTG